MKIATLFIGNLCLALGSAALGQIVFLDGGFETPETGGSYPFGNSLVYSPTGTPWNFAGSAGTQGYPISGVFLQASPPIEGSHLAFLQGAGSSISQDITLPAYGTYSLSYYIAGRQYDDPNGGSLNYQVLLDTTVLESDSTADFQGWTLKSVTLVAPAGSYQLSFDGVSVPSGRSNDQTAFVDAITITAVPEPVEFAAVAALALVAFGAWRRTRR